MQRQDLNIMSEFLVMAATLLDIKSRMLLPKEVNEEGEEEDPRQELTEQLLEYKLYKFMSYELRKTGVLPRRCFRPRILPKEVSDYQQPADVSDLLGDMTLAGLYRLFKAVVRRAGGADRIPSAASLAPWKKKKWTWMLPGKR